MGRVHRLKFSEVSPASVQTSLVAAASAVTSEVPEFAAEIKRAFYDRQVVELVKD